MDDQEHIKYLRSSLAVVILGSNDYLNNYLLPSLYTSSYIYNPADYADLLIKHYTRQILVSLLNSTRLPVHNIFFKLNLGYFSRTSISQTCSKTSQATLLLFPGTLQSRTEEVLSSWNWTTWLHSQSTSFQSSSTRRMCIFCK